MQPLEKQLEVILSSMGEALLVANKDQKVIMMNQASGILLRVAPKEALGKKLSRIFNFFQEKKKKKQIPDWPIREAMQEFNIVNIRMMDDFYCKDRVGRVFPITMTIAPLMESKETATGVVILFQDVTNEKSIDRAKNEFVSLASHQLRTPLSTIKWYTEMLLAEDVGSINTDQKKFLEEIYQGNQRMVGLVGALLNVSRIDMGTFSIAPEPTKIVEVAESVVNELLPQIKAKKLKMEKQYDKRIPIINVDPKLMRIIFQNLLSNAVKYTPNGGEISLAIRHDESDIKIEVRDNGYGIPKSQQSKVFTKLFRADNVRERETDGTGLGLYIVKAIVEASGGGIWFESQENKGTRFIVTIPLKGMQKKEGTKGLT